MASRWTPERDETLRRLWPSHNAKWEGWCDALGMNVTPNSIYRRTCMLGLNKKRRRNPNSEDEERELVLLGDWYCKRHNRTFGSVVRKLDQLETRRRSLTKKDGD